MPKPSTKEPTTQQGPDGRPLTSLIRKSVLEQLGEPRDLRGVQVRPLWEDHYRVNVFVGLDTDGIRIAHSYFLVTDNGGNILAAAPAIARVY